ncbi:epoxide hydrolase family protein [Lentzea sp. JNUCC 0626]|uniref:epoxide hydrolase family protein n=1 Tax=Lentzea sp. JNUCC 0626 TaxID=3367513 RepID=UPI003747C70A
MRPFRIDVPDSALDDLRARIAATRWPAAVPGTGWERGVPPEYLRELAKHWSTDFDWRAVEQRLNSHDQFVTEIDGATVHFLHVRSPEPDARPLLLTHGWPGSVIEFLDVIGPLTDPRSHGGDPGQAFHLVVPSLPGHGFSGPVAEPGWDVPRIAGAWAELMSRLEYDSYFAQGGDWGSFISLELARRDPEHVRAVHVNMLVTVPSGDPAELAALSEQDFGRLGGLQRFDQELSGYLKLMSTRPSTVSFGLNDSPAGLLAWIVEKFKDWTDPAGELPEDAVDRDLLLANVSLYWLTETAGSAAQLYFEAGPQLGAIFTPGVRPEPVPVPLGVSVFGGDVVAPVRALAEADYPAIVSWSEVPKGGHFAAMEEPEAFVDEVRKFFGAIDG